MDENVVVTFDEHLVEMSEESEDYGSDTEYDIKNMINNDDDTTVDEMQVDASFVTV